MSGKTYPDPISPEMLPNWAHISDYEIARDIADTETEIATYMRLEAAERTIASEHPSDSERRLAAFRSDARPLQIAERRKFVDFLRRLQDARSLSALQLVAALHQERAS